MTEGETATFTVRRTGDNSNALTVNYSIISGGGPANLLPERAGEGDYTSIPTSYEFPAGSSESHEFTVTAVDDEVYEPRQYFTLTASGSYQDGDRNITFSDEVIVRIDEDDERYLTLSPVSYSALGSSNPEFMAKEGGISGGKNELKISLNRKLPYDLHIPYTVGPDLHTTAATSDDYTMSGGTAKIPINDMSVTIDVGIVDDNHVEPTEYFTLRFGKPTKPTDLGNALGTFNDINFRDTKDSEGSKLNSQRLSVSIMDNDTVSMGGIVYLRGEGGGGIPGFPSTRKTLTEGQSTTITAEIAGMAPSSNIEIPLKVTGFPSDEVTSADYSIPESITINSGEKSGSVTLAITDDTDDERYRELLVVEINDTMNFPSGYTKGDRSKYEVIMLDNDKTLVNLQSLSADKLTETDAQEATFELRIARRPKANPSGTPPFTGANTDEGVAKLVLAYTGKATRGTDYKLTPNRDIEIPKSGAGLPSNCSPEGEAVTCTVTLKVTDDNLYEGGSGTTESVKINLDTGKSSFNDGIKSSAGLSLTIEDNDLQPMFSIADVSGPENRDLTFQVNRSGARGNDVSVTAGTRNHAGATNSAIAGTDYTTKTQKLDFGRGIDIQTFVVAITDDNIYEPDDETFEVMLSKPVDNQGLPEPKVADGMGTAVGTITDNDEAPTDLTISVDTATIAEAAGKTTVNVTATITSPTRFATDQTVTVTVGNADNEGEASEGESGDYATVDQFTITILATEASGTGMFDLTPVNDRIDDDGEKISVEGELGVMTVTHDAITIVDDDERGITVEPVTLTLDEADDPSTDAKESEKTYEVALTSQPEGGTVTVNITNPGPTVATVDPSSLTFDADNWETAQMVTVIAKDDTIDDTGDQKTTTISHTVSADGTDYADEEVEVKNVAVTVLDDDEAPMALKLTVDTDPDTDGVQDTISEGADEPTVRITATLVGDTQFATDQTITITVGDSNKDTATEGTGGDYNTVNNFDTTLSAGEESVSHDLTLTLNDDSVDEPDETVTISGELAGVTVNDTMFTIEDNDDTPTVMLVLTPASINESGATNASTITATMDGKSSEAVTLEVSATPVTPAVAGDFTLSDTTTLTIPANTEASTGTVTITAVDNKVDAADKTVTVAATATGGNALVQAPGNQTLTIKDDDTRGITVSKATLTLDEEDNTATTDVEEDQGTYTVVLNSEPSGGTVTIGVVSGGTAVARVAPATLTFTASNWNVPQTVTVTAMPDDIDNPNDRRAVAITHTVTATGTDYDGATASGVTVTVNDDDGAPTLSINSPSVTEVDSGATATLTFTVRLTPESGNTVTVAYADAGTGTATSGDTDYATLDGGTLTFAPSETMKTVAVTVRGDDLDEPDETVVVRLSSPSNATLTGGATTLDGTGTINDNDATPTVSVADATAVSEGDVAAPDPPNNMTFTVTLSAASGRTVTVPYTLSGTATAGTDYTEPNSRSVTIAAGRTGADIEIPVAGDEVDEENETITVTLGTPTNATVSTAEGAGAASGTITDDDTRGVSVTPTALTVAEADNTGTAAVMENQETYKVVLTSQPTGAVTVNLKSGDESVARVAPATLTFTASDWSVAQTVTVTGQADVIDNANDRRTTNISHTVSAAGTDYASQTPESVAVTVTDDDAAPSGITLTANPDSVTENGGAKTITVTAAVNGTTRYAQGRTVSVSIGGGTATSDTDYAAVESFDITIGAGEDDASNTFTLTPTNDVLAEGNETIDVTGTLSGITITPDEITLTDNDADPTGITLSVDTNGAEDGTPNTVAEDAGATVVTVTATVNGDTRYVDAKTVAVTVADGTAASPADYAAVSNFNITIAAGAASQSGNFTVTPVDDDLDEPNETINVTGTLTNITITGATVTLTDTDDPVSFSIADAEATEGAKVTFMVTRAGAEENVASVKVTTATDSGDGVNAADADDYTAITTAQTLNFAKGVTSQTVEVQTTQDDLFEPDETFKAVLSAPALGDGDPGTGVTIEPDKGTATGTIKNDDTEPSFAVADASASEGDAITFTVTRRGAMDNAVSVKWNTKADSGANAASTTDYTPVTTATTLTFAKGVETQTFTVATTEDVLDEDNETFLVELTAAEGGTISTAQATGTINDDDAAPTTITLSVDADTGTNNVQSSIAEEGGVKTVRVTATIGGTTRFATAQTVTVTVGKDGDSATEGTDYAMVDAQSIEIPIGAASAYVDFMLTPTTDVLFEGSETISLEGTLTGVTFTNTAITITDDDAAPSAITLSVDADTGTNNVQSSIAEEGGVKTVRVTATIGGTTRFATAQTVTVTVGKDGDSATEGTDYAMVDAQSIEIPIGAASAYVDFMLTPTTDVLFEGSETISLEGTLTGVTFTNSSITITDDDAAPSAITLSVDTNAGGDGTPTTLGEGATATTVRVTATITSATRFATEQTVKVKVGKDGDSATEGTDYALVADQNIKIPAGAESAYVDFPLTPTHDILDEADETISVDGELTGVTFTAATITITDDDAAPQFITLAVDTNAGGNGTPTSVGEEAGATRVRVTATITSATRFATNQAVTFEVGKSADTATESTDYTEVGTLTITIDGGEASGYVDFTLTPTSDVLDEPNETISVHGTQANITFTDATITITDDDAAPSGITLSVDTNGSTSGTPSTVAEDAGATVVTVTATVNGTTRYVDAKTMMVSVDDDTAASPADYAAVSGFNITIAAGAASQTGVFTVTPVDDDLDEANETIDVAGTLSGVTITGATVTLTDTDAPVSFSIADAEATEGGKITFTVSRAGAEDNVASVKVATATDSGDDANPAGTDDYTAIATAQTLNFAKGVTSQTVEVQTTQDDLFEPDETFKAVLSAPALGENDPGTGVSIETGKGTATGTIKNDDTEPSFAVADASASEGDAITFTVTRSGAMDNVVSVKWNTKAATGAGAASATDYTRVTTAQTLTFAKDVGSQTFMVATTEDTLHEGNETFLVELTGAVGGTIATAEATGTINDDDAAPSGITLSVDTNGSTSGTPSTVAEDAGATVVTVTATVNGETRYVEAKTVVVSVADGTAASPADYAAVNNFNITIAAGAASHTGSFTVTPVDDDLDEPNETIDVTGTLTDVTITGATVTLTDTDDPVSFSIADAEATEGGKVTFTVSRKGAGDNVASVKVATAADSGEDVNAADADDYTAIATAQTLNFAKGVTSQTVEVQTTQDDLFEPDETFKAVLSAPALAENDPGTGVSIEADKGTATGTIKNDDVQPSFAVADASASEGDAITFTVTRSGAMDNAVSVKWNTKPATGAGAASASDYTEATTATKLDFAKGVGSQTFTVATTEDTLNEANETFLVELTGAVGGTITTAEATGTITNDDAAPTTLTLAVDADNNTENVQSSLAENGGAKTVKVTATLGGSTQFDADKTLTLIVGDDDDSATEGTDYTTVPNITITIPAGDQDVEHTFTLTPTDDAFREDNETISFDATLASVTVTGASITLTSDDAAPAITLTVDTDKDTDNVQTSLAEDGGVKTVRVTATLDGTTRLEEAADLTLAVGKNSDSATEGTDYTDVDDQTITIGAGVASVTHDFTLTPTDDDLYEGSETISLDGTLASVTVTATSFTLTDDDVQPSFAVADASTSEGDAITFTVTRSGAMDNAVSVKWNTKPATGAGAASASDYTEATTATKLDFAKGVGSQTFTVTTTEDTLNEANETFLVELTEAVGATISDAEATGTITNDDAAPTTLTLAVDADNNTENVQSSLAENGGAKTVKVTATLGGSTQFDVDKTLTLIVGDDDDSATEGTDYTNVADQTITIPAGDQNVEHTFTLTPTDDDIDEPTEEISIEGTLTGITVTGTAITITDDEDVPTATLVLTPSTINESGETNTSTTVTATLSGKSSVAVTLTVAATAGANTAAGDFTLTGTTLTIAAGDTTSTGTVTIAAEDNDIDAPNKTVTVSATASGGGVANPTDQILTINDDEGVPTATLVLTPSTINESGETNTSTTVTATLSGKSSVAVTLTVAATAGANTAAGDFTLTGTTLTIAAGDTTSTGTVTIAAEDNDIDAPNKTVTVSATASGGGVANPTDQILTINDDEGVPTATLVLTPSTINESGETNTSTTVTATLSGKSSVAVTLTVAATAGANTAAGDFTLTGTTLTIAAGDTTSTGTVTIAAEDNDIDAPNKTVTVSATASGGGVANPTDQILTINDDEGVPTATLVLTPSTINESGETNTSTTVTATLSGKSSVAVTLTVAATAGANTAAGDFTLTGTTLTIAAGDTTSTGTVTIAAEDNDIDAPNKTVTVSATASGGGVANPTDQILTINDDEGVPTATLVLTPSTINESGETNTSTTVTATLSGKSSVAVTLTVAATAGANTAAGDFTLTGTTLTIAAGDTTSTGTVTIAAEDNDIDAPNKTVTVSATASGGGVANPTDQILTINDDEGVPTATLVLTPSTINESGETNTSTTVTATLSGKSSVAVTLTVAATAGANTAAGDFTLTGTTLTIAAGDTTSTGTVTIAAEDNDIDAPNKTVTVSATASGGGVANPTDQILTINDDEGVPTATLVLTPSTINESGETNTSTTVTATLSGKSSVAVTLTVAATAGANTAAGDFTLTGTTLTIAAGDTTSTGTVTIAAEDNDIDAPNKTVTVSATASGGGVANPTDQILTINDDEGVPTATLVLTPSTINESGETNTSTTVTATLSGKSSVAVTLTVAATAGANTAAGDFTLTGTTLTIAAGDTTSTGTVTIAAEDNDIDAPNKTVTVSATASGGGVANPDNQTLTITDDEGTPTVTLKLGSSSINESGDGNSTTVTATLSGKSSVAVTLTVAATAGANTAAGDFTLTGTTLTIAAGDTTSTGTVTIAAEDNDIDAPNKTVTVSATASGGGVANPTDQILTINDDEGVPTATLVLTPSTINESGETNTSTTVTATLSGKSSVAVTLTVAATAGANTAAGDFTLTGTTLTIAAGDTTSTGTVTIAAEDNDIDAPNKTVTVSATASGGGVANPTDQILTINDDEGVPTATLVLTPSTINESGETNTSTTVTATLSGKSSVAVTLTVAATAGANTAAGDFTLTGTTLTIAAGDTTSTGTVTIAAEDNDIDAPNKTVTVSATASGGGVANPTDQILTITDDEGTPTVTLVLTPSTINESGETNSSTVTATLSGESSAAVTVEVSVPNDAPVTLSNNTTLTITAGAKTSTGTVTITAVDNDVDAPNASVVVSGVASGGGVASPDNQTLTITDDEGTPTVTLVLTPSTINESGGTNASTVTATLSGKSNTAVTLTVAAAAGANTAAADFTLSGTTLTIAADTTTSTGTVTITAVDNDIDAPNKTVTVSATASGGGVATPANQTLTITDDEGTPTVTLVLTPSTINESGGTNSSTVTATLSGESSAAVTVEVSVPNDAPVTLSNNTTLTITAGAKTSTGTVTITAVDNDVDAPNASVVVSGVASGGGVASPDNQTLTITDDEGTPTVTLVLTPSTINESGGTNASTVTATLSGKSNTAVTLTVAAAAGANTAAADFTLSGTTLTIAADTTTSTGTVTITAVDNDIDAPNKTVTVSATASGGGVATPANQTLTITDDEGTPTVTLVLTPSTINESGGTNSSTVTATLSGESSAAVTVEVSVPNDAPVTLSNNTTLTITAGAKTSTGTVTITAVDNDVDAPNASVVVSGVASGGGVASPDNQTLTITDDEGTPTVTLVLTPSTINESGGTNASTVTATLSGKSNTAVTLTVAAAAGANTAAADFTLSGTTLTIAADTTTSTGTVTITAVDNDIDAPNKTVTVSATASGGGVATPANQTLTITDDEGTPTVTLVLTPSTINESGGTNSSTVTATLSGESSAAVTVEVSVPNDAPVTLSNNTTLTITAGAKTSTGTVTITAVDNDVDAPNASVVVSGVASGGGVASPDNQTLTITDDEGTPTVTLVLTPSTINESGGTNASTVTATLSGASNEAVTLTVAAAAGTDTVTGDFTVTANKTLTIAKGTTTSTGVVTITAVDNDVDAPNKMVTVSATASGGGVAAPAPKTLTITDDEGTPTVTLVLTPTTITESGATNNSTVTATLSGASNEAVTLTVAAAAGTDTVTGDFTVTANKTLTIAKGTTTSTGVVTITAVDNDVDAPNKMVTVSATASGGGVAAPAPKTLTITDDEGTPTVTLVLTPTTITESGATNNSTVTATLSGASNEAVTLTVAAAAGTDTVTGDFTVTANKTLTIAKGTTTSTGVVTITAVDNDVDAPNKMVTVSATASGGGVAAPAPKTLTITDDEGTPTVTLVLTPTTITESGATNNSTVTATLSGASNEAVTLTVAAAAGTDTVTGDFTVTANKTLTIAKGTTTSTGVVTITAVDNDVDAPNKMVTVSATASGGGVAAPANQTLTINDDEGTPTVTLVLTPSTINESGNGNSSTVTATLSGESSAAVTVEVSVPNNAPVTLSNNTTLTITAGAKASTGAVTITAVDNSVNAPDKTVTVSATASGGGVANPTDQTLTITDDDTTPPTALTITVDINSINENAGETTVTVTATLDGTSRFGVNQDVTVTIGKDSDTAVEGTDYKEVGNLTVRINAGDASGSNTFKLTPINDAIDEQDETISLEGTLEELTVTDASITLTDDDEAPSGLTITVDTDPVKDGIQDSVDEDAGGTRVSVTAALKGTTSFGVDKTVNVTVGNQDRDSATEGTDYKTVNDLKTTLTLKAGETSISTEFTLTPINDGIDEQDETISVEGDLTGLPKTYDSITITDDDEAPSGLTITVDTDSGTDGDQDSVGEGAGATTVRVTATLDGTSRFAASQTVTVSVGGGTATSGTDYEKVPGFNITIVAGEASGSNTFTLILTDDKIHEGDETINVTGTLGLGSLDPAKATIIITDNDAAPTGLRISVDTGSPENLGSSTRNLSSERDRSLLYEDAKTTTTVTVTATLDGASRFSVDQTVIVTVGADSDTAEEGRAIWGTDYTAVPSFKITIGADAKSGTSTFDITPIDDKLAEGDETINLEGTLTGITVTGTTITITDDDTAPTGITLTVDPASVGEEDGKPEITVKAAVNGATRYTKAKTVTVSVGGGTATSETDYEEVPGFDITIGAGAESATHTFTLILIDDKIHEGDETINVTGTSGSLTVTDATLTIEDDEELPVVSINSPSVKESGKSGVPTEMTFTVTIFPESTKLVTVSYADTGTGTASADKDYVSPGTGILTFAPGITRRRIAITVKGDDIDEYDETVVLRLNNPTNATLPDNVAALESTGTIIDNNEPPTVSLLDSEPVEEGEVAVFPVRLSGESGKPITVSWKTSSGTALEDVDYHGGSEQITIHAGTVEKTVEITTIDDREIEDWTENFSVALSDPVNVTPESIKATGIIKDDDRPAAIERLERVNKTILPYVGSAIMRSRIDHVTGCIKHAASGVAYGDLSSFEGQLRNNADILEQHQMERISFLDVFNDARFASGFKAYEEKHNPGDVTFCAGSDWNELSGGDDDPVTWDGSLAGTHLGGNVRISEWILTGLDLFLYTGSFDWKDEGGEEEFRGIEGEWNLNIRGVNPYVALLSEDGETQFWTMAGYGFGRVDIEEEILDQSADITMKSVALGGAVPLRKGSGNVSLSLRGDLWLGEFEIAENGDLINGVSVQTRGARALLESTWNRGSITPSLLVGIKHDNSSSDSTGMEIGSGIEWGSSSHGLRVSLKSRALLVRSSIQEWGVSGDVNLSPRDGLGPSLRLTTSRGDAEERASTFLEDDSETLLGESGEGGISFEAEAGWGISAAGGRGTMTPFAGVALLERDERVLRLGGRLDMGKTLDLQLEGQREKNEINGSEYGLLVEAKFSF